MTAEIVRFKPRGPAVKTPGFDHGSAGTIPAAATIVTLPVIRIDRETTWDSMPSDCQPWHDQDDFS